MIIYNIRLLVTDESCMGVTFTIQINCIQKSKSSGNELQDVGNIEGGKLKSQEVEYFS